MISSHSETADTGMDEAPVPPQKSRFQLDADAASTQAPRPQRSRLKRIGKRDTSAAAKRAKTKLKQLRSEPTQSESTEVATEAGPPIARSAINRIAPKKDGTAERRRQKLAHIRRQLREESETENPSDGSVLAHRLHAAIRASATATPNAADNPPKLKQPQCKPAKTTVRTKKKKKHRASVGRVLDPGVVRAKHDVNVTPVDDSGSSSDAQAVSIESLRAELEQRQQMAVSAANFQLDASPSMPASAPSPPIQQAEVSSAADVREVDGTLASTTAPPASPNAATIESRDTLNPSDVPVAAAPELSRPVPSVESVALSDIQTSQAEPGLTLVEPPPPEVEPYADWFKRVVVRNRWLTWFTTFYVHWMVLLLLAAIIVHGPEQTADLLLSAAFAEEEEEPSTAPFEVTVPVPEPEAAAEPEADSAEAADVPATMIERPIELPDSLLSELAPEGSENTENSEAEERSDSKSTPTPPAATKHVDVSPAQAVRQGSFSVWTEPPNPRPGDPYRIIIQVRLPEQTQRYLVTDLQGVVVGSDGYRKPIPGFAKGELPIVDGYARLAVPIVSADKKVRDTVFIRSRLLRETQKLLIEFK